MNRVKRVKNDNFTTISNVFLRDERLSLKAKGFLAVVMGLPEGWNFTVEGICAILKENKTAVYSTINELKKYGYCYSSRIKSEKGLFLGSDYTFFEDPNMYNHSVVYPHTENPHTDVPHTENVSQLNTYSNKVLIESIKEEESSANAEIARSNVAKSETNKEVCKEVVSLFNCICTGLSRVEKITTRRDAKIAKRHKELGSLDKWKELFCKVKASAFMNGDNQNKWKASFDWLIENDNNYVKVLEGNYSKQAIKKQPSNTYKDASTTELY